ncbi:MAG: porin [candidate division WOR-3 bacterium]
MRRQLIIFLFSFSFSFLFAQSCLFAEEGVNLDACIWTNYQYIKSNDTCQNTFSLRNAFLGFTKNINKYLTARIYLDVGDILGKPAYDLYCALKKSPWEIRIGQFKQFLGMEMLLPPPKLDFIEYSLIGKYRAPVNPRDVGLLLIYREERAELAFACVNGTGKNVLKDDNRWKDLSGRLALRQKDLLFGGNFYYGKLGKDDSLKGYERWGLELGVKTPLELASEFLFLEDTLKGKGFYFALIYRQKRYEPLFRYDWLEYNKVIKKFYTLGINFIPLKEKLKLALNYIWQDKKIWRILSQLQIAY